MTNLPTSFYYKEFKVSIWRDVSEGFDTDSTKYNIRYHLKDCPTPHSIIPQYEKTASFNSDKCIKLLTKQDKRYITNIVKLMGYPLANRYYEG